MKKQNILSLATLNVIDSPDGNLVSRMIFMNMIMNDLFRVSPMIFTLSRNNVKDKQHIKNLLFRNFVISISGLFEIIENLF